jgi:hypothetical protein
MAKNDDQLIEAIAADVIKVLTRRGFFEQLDDKFSPRRKTTPPVECGGKFEVAEPLLRSLGFDATERAEFIQVLQSRGGYCDCEILYNVSDKNRLKSKFWKERAAESAAAKPKARARRKPR